ncbi:hypothetical protein ZIOFF_010885 [Zingiber officinale]|uniref:Uncharacterized protein n=1 Tax=Zingiber officinale TaxID=94328 RepID=A0A8J5HJE2_ZINOF|nr:hypothetical protein ZIOFF_010885 [Zingiber officinale]
MQPPRICSHDTASAHMRQRHNFMHTNYSVLYKKSFPPQTAPAGYVYPTCSASFTSDPLVHTSVSEEKDKGGATSVFSDKDSRPTISSPATDDKYLDEVYNSIVGMSCSKVTESEIVEVDGPNDLEHQLIKDQEPCLMKTEFDEPMSYLKQ